MSTWTLNEAIPPEPTIVGAGKNTSTPSLSWDRIWLHILKGGVWLIISIHLSAKYNASQILEELVDTSLIFSLWLAPTIKPTNQHSLKDFFLAFKASFFMVATKRMEPQIINSDSPWSLCSWISQDYNRSVINGCGSISCGYASKSQCSGNRQKFQFFSFPLEQVWMSTSPVAIWESIS